MSYAEDISANERRQRIADMLMQQGQEPVDTNQMAGGYVVPVSPLVGLGKIAQQLSGAFIGNKASKERGRIEQKNIDELSSLDFNAPDAPQKLASLGKITDALALQRSRQAQTPQPGQWYYPPDAVEEEFLGMKGARLKNGGFIPSRAGMSEYQQLMTSPSTVAEIAAARSGNQIVKMTDESGRPFVDYAKNVNPNIAAGQPQQPQTQQGYLNPQELNALTQVESGNNPSAVSSTGAQGVAQIQPETAAQPGFGVPSIDLSKTTPDQQKQWANNYMAGIASEHPTWTKEQVLAAYNTGPNTVATEGINEAGWRYNNKIKKVLGQSPAEKAASLIPGQLTLNEQKLQQERANKKATEDRAFLENEPQRIASIDTSTANAKEYKSYLDAYSNQVGTNPLLSNNYIYNMRATAGTDPIISNIESGAKGFIQDQIKSLQAVGISPTQMMNTETEARRFMESVVGNGNADAKQKAFQRFMDAKDRDLNAFNEQRKKIYERNGLEYQPIPGYNELQNIQKPSSTNEVSTNEVKFLGFE